MDIKELLGKDAADLEKLTDKELREYFAPYMKWIKPVVSEEKVKSKEAVKIRESASYSVNRALQMANEIAKKYGIDISNKK